MSSFLRRRESSSSPADTSGLSVADAAESKRWPALLEFLGTVSWPDGSSRESGTLLLFLDQGRLKVCLGDRAQSLALFVTSASGSLLGLLDHCEKQLQAPAADWRPAKGKGKR